MPELSFYLNGQPTTVDFQEGMNLLEVLRDVCGVTSPKDGCSPQGGCGCCTVLVNGRAVLSCLRRPESVEGQDVTTLEGVPEEKRRILVEAFLKEGGLQCGYCTPGIAARVVSLLDRDPDPGEDEIRKALSGHLCRCTGYHRIVDAVLSAAEGWRDGGPERGEGLDLETGLGQAEGMGLGEGPGRGNGPRRGDFFGEALGLARSSSAASQGVGSSSPRYRGAQHVLGEKEYIADMTVDGMLHGAAVLSRYPRARVLGMDTAKVLSLPGVVRILTAEDVPGTRHVGLIRSDWPVFVRVGEITRCVGDMLALVLAESRFSANQAAAALEEGVLYDVLGPVTDPFAALDTEAPDVHEGGNLLDVCAYSRGDVEAALAASVHRVEQTFTTQRIEHAFLEPEACLAIPQGSPNGPSAPAPAPTAAATATAARLKVFTQGQGVHEDQRQIASVLGISPEEIEVELVTNGGAFGGKEDLSVQAQTALGAYLSGRPVRTVLTRDQSMLMHPKRHPLRLHYEAGADADGRLTAVRARIMGDTGAYASVGMKVLERAAGHACGPYRVPAVDVEAKTVYTNNPPCGAMRGFGANQAAFAMDGIMDLLAEKVGIDGYDIRDRNILGPGERFATGQLLSESCGIRQTLEAVRDTYKGSRYAGIACGIKNTGIGNGMEDSGRLLIRVLDGGHLELLTGFTEMGQGLFTVIRQVVEEETGIPPEHMTVRTVSDPRVLCGMTTASRATALMTAAAQIAARKLAGEMEGPSPEALAGREFHGEYVCDFTVKPGTASEDPLTHMAFSYATQVVILDDSGKLEKVVAAHDVGRAINPLQCAGQIEGGVHMGLGFALSEDFPCTDGRPDSLRLADLGILKAKDTPPVEVILIEVPDQVGGYGSKGVGEIGLVPTAGAVAGALFSFDGKRRFHLPMSDAPAAAPSVPKSRRN